MNDNMQQKVPSSYQQIIKNMRDIENNIYPVIEKLNASLFSGDPTKSDVVIEDDGSMRVVGTSVSTENADVDIPPRGYFREFTTEIKKTDVAGLSDTIGFSSDYLTLFTQSTPSSGTDYPAWQLAIGDEFGTMYFRTSINGNTWGDWKPVVDLNRMLFGVEAKDEVIKALLPKLLALNPDIHAELTHRQLTEAHRQPEPEDQYEGDYWLRPVDVANQVVVQPIDDPFDTDFINEYTYDLWPFFNRDMTVADIDWADVVYINVKTPWEIYPDNTLFVSDYNEDRPNIDALIKNIPTDIVFFDKDDVEGAHPIAIGDLTTEDLEISNLASGTAFTMSVGSTRSTVDPITDTTKSSYEFRDIDSSSSSGVDFSGVEITSDLSGNSVGSAVSLFSNK